MLTVKKVNRVILIPYRKIDLFKPFHVTREFRFCIFVLVFPCKGMSIAIEKMHISANNHVSQSPHRGNVLPQ